MEDKVMTRMIIMSAILGIALSTNALAAAENSQTTASSPAANAALQHSKKQATHARKPQASRSSSTVTYNVDSKNPNIGWHTVNGMRVCTDDCDNPEIPGSGYTCKNVNVLGMAMRECTSSSW
jgi:hypothetical protein